MTTLKIVHKNDCETVVSYPVFFWQKQKNQMQGSGKVGSDNGLYQLRQGDVAYLVNDAGNTIGRYFYQPDVVDSADNK